MPEQLETTHTLMENELVVYRRERSSIWQCRYKVGGVWQRASTKERVLKLAKKVARELMIRAEIRKHDNLPVITRRFRDVAKLAIQRMETMLAGGSGKVSFKDYIRVINEYLIPALGNKLITNIDAAALDQLDSDRIKMMGKAPSNSTLLTQNAALNRVFDEGVTRNFLTGANRPKLEALGRKGDKRPAFDLNELRAVLANFDGWIERGKTDRSKEMRVLMRDYVELLVDTGARPGKELMNLKWNQIKFEMSPTVTATNQMSDVDSDEPEHIVLRNLNRSVEMTVSGKTGARQIIGRQPTVKVLERVAGRNYAAKGEVTDPFKGVITAKNNDFVLRTKKDKDDVSGSFQKMLERYLEEHNLLLDPQTGQNRVFYSFRHTYATLAITYDKTNPHVLATQMGTSIGMLEKHYSHLKVKEAIEQLRGEETRRLIEAGGVIDEIYKTKRDRKVIAPAPGKA